MPIEAPPTEFDSVEDDGPGLGPRRVSVLIPHLPPITVENEDHAAQVMLHWFITEQVEEEKLFRDILAELRKVDGQSDALLLLDRDMGNRADTDDGA